jgi:hypothetical protein
MRRLSNRLSLPRCFVALALAGCGNNDPGELPVDDTGTTPLNTPDTYAFDSAFGEGSAVSYSGQICRHLLLDDLITHIGGLTERIDSFEIASTAGEVEAELSFYYDFDSDIAGDVSHNKSLNGDATQTTYNEVSSGKDLNGKIAGNDETGYHVTEFIGWDADGVTTPESLVRQWFGVIDDQALDWYAGQYPLDGEGNAVTEVYITSAGQDLRQLIQKFILGAVAFSQGTDDYLDSDTEAKGLNASHEAPEDGGPYTDLEHNWDEAFGYFGAASTYPQWTDEDVADLENQDVDGDGTIDLLSEVNWGHSVNAAKRDTGAVIATDFTAAAWEGFAGGRDLLNSTAGTTLSDDDFAQLLTYRDQAVTAWEATISSTCVHYINDVLEDMSTIGTTDYSFANHAKHWSELKGFALSLQFSPHSPLTDADLTELHDLLGTAPVTAGASPEALNAYSTNLETARSLLATAYGFEDENVNAW